MLRDRDGRLVVVDPRNGDPDGMVAPIRCALKRFELARSGRLY
jgi:hypothetical protein